jgi:AcrR family transcriptional regulator
MNTAPTRRRRPRGATRRAQILDAATAVFLEHGYAGATIELIVARAGASKATIYSFFGDKEGLFTALIVERAERILAGFPDVEVGKVDVPTALAAIARRYMDVAMSPDAIGLFRLILAEGPRFPDLVKRFYRVGHDRVAAGVAKALRTWARRGRISADDPDRLATQLLDVVRGDLHLRVVAGLPPDDLAEAIERNIDHGVRTFWRAVSPRSGERDHAD